MNRNLERVMPHVFRHEGGYVDHPADPGGATNLGVTLRTLSAWRGRAVTKAQVRALGPAEATQIYRRQYWAPVQGDELPGGVDYAVFDFAIHSGPKRAAEYLQRTVGARVDGQVGVHTLAAVRAADPRDVVARLCAARLRFLKRIRDRQTKRRLWDHFGRGWQRRLDEVETLARQLAGEAGGARGKGSVTDVRLPASRLAAALPGALRRALARLATTLINAFIKPGRSS
jgi:lysozyme family protein